jgi:hypothetical protein
MAGWGRTHDVAIQPPRKNRAASSPVYGTALGSAYCGDPLKLLQIETTGRVPTVSPARFACGTCLCVGGVLARRRTGHRGSYRGAHRLFRDPTMTG